MIPARPIPSFSDGARGRSALCTPSIRRRLVERLEGFLVSTLKIAVNSFLTLTDRLLKW